MIDQRQAGRPAVMLQALIAPLTEPTWASAKALVVGSPGRECCHGAPSHATALRNCLALIGTQQIPLGHTLSVLDRPVCIFRPLPLGIVKRLETFSPKAMYAKGRLITANAL